LVRTFFEIDNVNELSQLIIRRNSDGSVIRLGDMAACHDTLDPKAAAVRYNGTQAISLQISKIVGGNSIDVVDKAKEVVEQFRADLPEGFAISFFNDSTIRIRSSISVLVTNAISGFILLVIILWLFLGVRNAFVAALGIPVAFSMTFIILELLGETLNSNSLFGLVLVLGMIVDHAIVIVENSYRLQTSGLPKREAAIAATDEVVWPVFSATLTTIAAFLPLMILPGILGRFFRVIPLVVSVALVVSTIEAFTFLPLHFVEWGSQQNKPGSWFSIIEKWFIGIFKKLLKVKYYVVSGAFVLAIAVISLLGRVKQDLFSGEDYTYFFIDIELPVGTPKTKTNGFVRKFEEIILMTAEKGEVKSVSSVIGRSSASGPLVTQNNVAQITVDLYELNAGRTRPISNVMEEIQKACSTVPGAESVRFRRVQGGPPVDPPISIRFFGDTYEDLQAIAGKMKNKLQQYPELYNIKDNLEKGTPELRVVVDQDKVVKYGLTSSMVGMYLRAGFDGIVTTRIFDDNENIDVIVQYRGDDITSVNQMMQMKIPTPQGGQIPLSALSSVQEKPVISTIKRVEGKREVTITAEAWNKKNIRTINKECQDVYEWEIKPTYPNVEFKAGGEFAEFSNILFQILRLFLIGLFIIYLLLGSQFKSYIQPFLILFTLPFAFAGIILFLIISGTPFSTTVLYAGVALAGVAVNDSIVLISFINGRIKNCIPIKDAIVQSVQIRLRPIVLTSVTTIAGLLPTALGIGGYSIVWGPMASTIIFGLIVSTITTLVIIPLLYAAIGDRRRIVPPFRRK
ncbi:MAG: efflux RND transporter permease subunit, partial [Chitinispirillia bacterium]